MTQGSSTAPPYARTAASPRMLVLLVLLLGAAAVCARLGAWQLDRAEIRGEARAEREAAEQAAAGPVGLDEVLSPQQTFDGSLVGRAVTLVGAVDGEELRVSGRSLDGRTGELVLTPVRVTGSGGVLPVVRGWVPTGEDADPLPPGEVRLTGYLQGGEAAGAAPEDGRVTSISPGQLVNLWDGPVYTGYLVLTEPAPPSGVAPLPPPTAPGSGMNVQNLAYAVQWWIFGAFALLLWLRIVRDEARDAVEGPKDEPAGLGEPAEHGEQSTVPTEGVR